MRFVRSFLVLGVIWGLYGLFLYNVQGHGSTVESPHLYTASVAGVSTSVVSNQSIYVSEINSARAIAGVSTVVEDDEFTDIALSRAKDMQAQQYYAHRSPQGFTFVDYFSKYSISTSTYSCENLLLTASENPAGAVAEWLQSPPHRECLLNPAMTTIGFAKLPFFPDSADQQIFVAIFAQR